MAGKIDTSGIPRRKLIPFLCLPLLPLLALLLVGCGSEVERGRVCSEHSTGAVISEAFPRQEYITKCVDKRIQIVECNSINVGAQLHGYTCKKVPGQSVRTVFHYQWVNEQQ